MKFKRINNTLANLNRLGQILYVFRKYGFAELIEELDFSRYLSLSKLALSLGQEMEKEIAGRDMPRRAAMAFQELGPTFIKVGQLLSTRSDMLRPEYINAFDSLKDQVKPFSFEKVEAILQQELNYPQERMFKKIDPVPLAAASVSQVHAAVLHDGSEVVVKIRRPGIRNTVKTDMRIMNLIVSRLKKRFPREFEVSDPGEIVREFERIINEEMDFTAESANAERFRRNFKEEPLIHIPR
ncbi:MAG: ABC1 kinase family protein, partial [bacterium]